MFAPKVSIDFTIYFAEKVDNKYIKAELFNKLVAKMHNEKLHEETPDLSCNLTLRVSIQTGIHRTK